MLPTLVPRIVGECIEKAMEFAFSFSLEVFLGPRCATEGAECIGLVLERPLNVSEPEMMEKDWFAFIPPSSLLPKPHQIQKQILS